MRMSRTGEADPSPCVEHCGELVTELIRHARLLHLMKARNATHMPGVDAAAFGVLMVLVRQGPRRQGEVAEATLLDPSTVSRYAAQLVKAGLISRRPDPADGRAVQLVAAPQGIQLAEEGMARRSAALSEALSDWPAEDAATLIRLLRRLNDGLEAQRDGSDTLGRPIGA
jgi:DNA-binding MarR family transcriptional regulator